MNKNRSSQPHALVALYSTPGVKRIFEFASTTANLNTEELAAQYTDLRASATVKHVGTPRTKPYGCSVKSR